MGRQQHEILRRALGKFSTRRPESGAIPLKSEPLPEIRLAARAPVENFWGNFHDEDELDLLPMRWPRARAVHEPSAPNVCPASAKSIGRQASGRLIARMRPTRLREVGHLLTLSKRLHRFRLAA